MCKTLVSQKPSIFMIPIIVQCKEFYRNMIFHSRSAQNSTCHRSNLRTSVTATKWTSIRSESFSSNFSYPFRRRWRECIRWERFVIWISRQIFPRPLSRSWLGRWYLTIRRFGRTRRRSWRKILWLPNTSGETVIWLPVNHRWEQSNFQHFVLLSVKSQVLFSFLYHFLQSPLSPDFRRKVHFYSILIVILWVTLAGCCCRLLYYCNLRVHHIHTSTDIYFIDWFFIYFHCP